MKETSNKGYEQGCVYLPYKLEFTVPKHDNIFSITRIVEGTFSPKILLRNRYSNVEVNGICVYLPYKLEFTVPKHDNIFSITRIVEGTFSPKMLLRNRYSNVEVNGMFHETIGEKKSKGKQIFSDIDPYGEENWDD